MAFSNPFVGWHSSVPLVRPYVRSRHPEPAPSDAARPIAGSRCDRCPAVPLVVLWRIVTTTAPAVLDLQFCGSHANAFESPATAQGWCVVLDHRQALVDSESR